VDASDVLTTCREYMEEDAGMSDVQCLYELSVVYPVMTRSWESVAASCPVDLAHRAFGDIVEQRICIHTQCVDSYNLTSIATKTLVFTKLHAKLKEYSKKYILIT
jgi:hypothetical protein